MTAMTILSETGWDMSKWETEDQFCFLAAALSGQSDQRRQDHWERSAADEQSGQYHLEVGGHHPTAKQDLSGSTVPPSEKQTDTPVAIKAMAAKLARLVYRMLRRNEIRGPRSGVLRGPTPPTIDQTSEV